MKMIRREIGITTGFYQQVPAYRLANDLGVDYQTVTRVFQNLRLLLYHTAELEGSQLSGEAEMDEAYFGGKRKGKRGRGAVGKSIVFGLLERDGRVYTRVVEGVSAETLMGIIKKKMRKGSVYYSDTFKSCNSLKRLGKHHTVNQKTWSIRKQKIISTALKVFPDFANATPSSAVDNFIKHPLFRVHFQYLLLRLL